MKAPNSPMKSDERPPRLACRAYRLLLRLYPADHRRDYEDLMLQLFGDLWRDGRRASGGGRSIHLWRRLVADFVISVVRENVSAVINLMKTPTIHQLSHILFAGAIVSALFSSPAVSGTVLASTFIYLSTLLILARAVVEWFRPPGESAKAIGWGVAVLIAYAFVLPFWAQLHAIYGVPARFVKEIIGAAIFLNLIVPLLRMTIDRVNRVS
jgi:hypothetical protein